MKEAIQTANAPAPIGPYSQAIRAGGFLYISGQTPMDPVTGAIPETVEEQTQLTLKNLDGILTQAGLSKQAVVKTTVFIKDMNDFPRINQVYATYFEGCVFPARSCVEVARLPRDILVEIEAVALAT